MWSRVALCCVCLIWTALSCWAGPLSAQTPEVSATARTLFETGVQHADAHEWSAAEQQFRQALSLRESPVIRFNLAIALMEQQKLREAHALLIAVRDDPSTKRDLHTQLPELLETLARRTPSLTISLEAGPGSVDVTLDGRALTPAELDVAIELDPGLHTVRMLRAGRELERHQVSVAEGTSPVVLLQEPALAPPVQAVPLVAPVAASGAPAAALQLQPAASERARDDDPRARRRRRLWGLGAGAAILVAAVVTGALLATRSRDPRPPQGDFDPPTLGVRVPQ